MHILFCCTDTMLLPALVIGAQRPEYRMVRLALAGVAALAAATWLVQRTTGAGEALAEAFAAVLPPLGAALVVVSLGCGVWALLRRSPVADVTNRA